MNYSEELHARLRELHQQASPAPWVADEDDDQRYLRPDGDEVINTDAAHVRAIDTHISVESRNALPALLDEIERLQNELETALPEAWKNGYADCLCDIEAVYDIDREAIVNKTVSPYQEQK